MHPKQIPGTPQTDPANFPAWEKDAAPGRSGSEYPKQLTRVFTQEDVQPWVDAHRKHDKVQREDFWEKRCPKVGDEVERLTTQDLVVAGYAQTMGLPVECKSKEDEEAIRKILGLPSIAEEAAKAVDIPIGESPAARLRRENEELEFELERNVKLKAKKAEQHNAVIGKVEQRADRPPRGSAPARKKRKYTRRTRTVPLDEFAGTES